MFYAHIMNNLAYWLLNNGTIKQILVGGSCPKYLFIYLFIKAQEKQIDLQMFESLQQKIWNVWKEHKFYMKYVNLSQVKKLYSSFKMVPLLSSPFSGLSHSSWGICSLTHFFMGGLKMKGQFNDMTQVCREGVIRI